MLHEFDALFTQSDLKDTFAASNAPVLQVGSAYHFSSGNLVFRLAVTAHGSSKGSTSDVVATQAGCLCASTFTHSGTTYAGTCAPMPSTGPPFYKEGDAVEANWVDGGVFYDAQITATNADGTFDVEYTDGTKEGPLDATLIKWRQALDSTQSFCVMDFATCAETSSSSTSVSPMGSTWDYCDQNALASQYLDVTVAVLSPVKTTMGCTCKAEYTYSDVTYFGNCKMGEDGHPWCYTSSCPEGGAAPAGDGWDTCASTCHSEQYLSSSTGKCVNWAPCPTGFHETKAPSLTSDRECVANAGTPSGCVCKSAYEYEGVTHAGTCTEADSSEPWCYVDCWDATSNADGGDGELTYSYCAQCGVSQYLDPLSGVCNDLTECGKDEHETVKAATMENRQCKQNTICTAAQFVLQEATGLSDRVCGKGVTCTAQQYELVGASATSTRVCEPLRVCDFPSTEYETRAPTAMSNRICGKLSPVCSTSEYEKVAASATRDRVCAWRTTCALHQYVVAAATATTDTQCALLTVCKADE